MSPEELKNCRTATPGKTVQEGVMGHEIKAVMGLWKSRGKPVKKGLWEMIPNPVKRGLQGMRPTR